MKKSIIHSPHDKIFRSSLQFPEVAREFLELFLREPIKRHLDYNSVTYCQTTFVDEELKLSQTDVLFTAKFKGKLAYIYILAEHESKVDPLIAFWLFKYMTAIWDYHTKQYAGMDALPLPLIIPLVFYTGGAEYTAERQFSNLFGEHSQIMKDILQEPFHLVDVDKLPEKVMTSHIFAGTMSFIMRKKFRTQINHEIHKIISNLNTLEGCDHQRFVIELIQYMLNVDVKHTNINELVEILKDEMSPAVENEMMSLAEKLIEQGIERGIEQGIERGIERGIEQGVERGELQIIKKMLSKGVAPEFIAKNTGVAIHKIKDLQKKTSCLLS